MYENVLLPTDGSTGVERAIEQAVGIASENGAKLHALYVVEPVYWMDLNVERVLDALEEEGTAATETVAERAAAAGVECVTTIAHGYPSEEILEYVEEKGIDLIVMGTHGRRGLSRMLLGSTAEHVVRLADVPVLTVRMTDEDEDDEEGEDQGTLT